MSKFKEHIHNFTCVSNSYRKNWSFLLYTCNEIPWFLFLLLVISLDKNSACHIASITINNNLCIPNPIQLTTVCAKHFRHAAVKKILNVHIENWFTMELPSKMNSELESNTPPHRSLWIPFKQIFACQDFLNESPTPFHKRC